MNNPKLRTAAIIVTFRAFIVTSTVVDALVRSGPSLHSGRPSGRLPRSWRRSAKPSYRCKRETVAGTRMCGRDDAVSDLPAGEVTELLRAWHAGDEAAYARVSAMLYDELRSRAAQYMRRQRAGDSLQATALVHEAFLRLHNARQVDWHDRNHFLAVAARTMRRVLVDLARAKASAKRGGRPAARDARREYRRSGARARSSRSDRAG